MYLNDLSYQEKILFNWFRGMGRIVGEQCYHEYIKFKNKIHKGHPSGELIVLNPISLLGLIEELIILNHEYNDDNISGEEFEILLFKAYLLKNQSLRSSKKNEKIDSSKLNQFFLEYLAAQYEFTTRKDILPQLLLASSFFRFVSSNEKFKMYYLEFIKERRIESFSKYLLNISMLYSDMINKEYFNHKIEDSSVRRFFDSLSLELGKIDPIVNSNGDFKILREKPLFKVSDDKFCPVHLNFFVDKVYQGLVFDFYKSTSLNRKFKGFDNYLQHLGKVVEKEMFQNFMDLCFPSKHFKKVTKTIHNGFEYSDYYVRDNHRIFIFEFKNSIVNSQIKYSYDFNIISAEIRKKLYLDDSTGKKKAVLQLIDVISALHVNDIPIDNIDLKNKEKLEVYPIIVHTDLFFSLDGINYYLNNLFIEAKKEIENEINFKINDLILVSIPTIFDIINKVEKGEFTFAQLCKIYLKKKNRHEKQGLKPTSEVHISRQYRGFDTTMSKILSVPEASSILINQIIETLEGK